MEASYINCGDLWSYSVGTSSIYCWYHPVVMMILVELGWCYCCFFLAVAKCPHLISIWLHLTDSLHAFDRIDHKWYWYDNKLCIFGLWSMWCLIIPDVYVLVITVLVNHSTLALDSLNDNTVCSIWCQTMHFDLHLQGHSSYSTFTAPCHFQQVRKFLFILTHAWDTFV